MVKKEDLDFDLNGYVKADQIHDFNLSKFCYRRKGSKLIGFNIDFSNDLAAFLFETFKIDDGKYGIKFEDFHKKVKEAITGDGNEIRKINAIYSSALCSLLMFCRVSENNEFSIADSDGREHVFNEVYFEVKNKVFNRPSNMDVVLVNKETREILFIESKFSEYLHNDNFVVGQSYKADETTNEILKTIDYDGMKTYKYGIKQIIAHYVGINNFVKGYKESQIKSYYNKNDRRYALYNVIGEEKDCNKYQKVFFMELVFVTDEDRYRDYERNAKNVFEALPKDKGITYLGTQTYQEIFKQFSNANVPSEITKSFYRLNDIQK